MTALVEAVPTVWPLGLPLAALVLSARRRASRRQALDRALHELRRPLQALVLCADSRSRPQVDQALQALADLDRELNGGRAPLETLVRASDLAREAVKRWEHPAEAVGRTVRLRWRAGAGLIRCDAAALSRALDNLIANSLEHGAGRIVVEGAAVPGAIRIVVSDEGGARPSSPARAPRAVLHPIPGVPRRPGRGHGLAIVSAIAARHSGRFACAIAPRQSRAVLELPLAG